MEAVNVLLLMTYSRTAILGIMKTVIPFDCVTLKIVYRRSLQVLLLKPQIFMITEQNADQV